jgi:hypothetical protein
MAGFLINSRGTTMRVNPVLKGFDMPVMIKFPNKMGKFQNPMPF